MKIRNKEVKSSSIVKPKRNLTAILVIGISVIAIGIMIFFTLSKMLATESYYVLTQDIAPKTQITPAMLTAQETPKGTRPKNALDMNVIQQGNVYAKYPLYAGDVVASSNAGANKSTFNGVPDDWTVFTTTISQDKAVNGTIAKGDYFDVIGVDKDGKASYLAVDVLAMDVAGIAEGDGTNNTKQSDDKGATLIYTVGMPQNVAKQYLASTEGDKNYTKIFFTRSPISARYQKRGDLDVLRASENLDDNDDPKYNTKDEAIDLYDGTDPTFAPVIRDKNNRPVNKDNCKEGKIQPAKLCTIHAAEIKATASQHDSKDTDEK